MLFASIYFIMLGCKPVIELETDRTIVAVNLPEITDLEPKALSPFTTAKVTIIGKNFTDVEQVQLNTTVLNSTVLQTLIAQSFTVENPNRIVATFSTSSPFNFSNIGLSRVTITAKRGASASDRFIIVGRAFSGRITIDKKPFDNVLFYCTKAPQTVCIFDVKALAQNVAASEAARGYYSLPLYAFGDGLPMNNNFLLQGKFTFRPFLTGHAFTPSELVFEGDAGAVGGLDFTGQKLPTVEIPTVSDIQPRFGVSNSGGQQTGTDFTVNGKGLSGLQKVLVAVRYGNPSNPDEQFSFEEGSILHIDNDAQVVIRLPRFDRTKAFSGSVYNCRIYLLRNDTSVLAEQVISVRYI
jgi:hypothetical protein